MTRPEFADYLRGLDDGELKRSVTWLLTLYAAAVYPEKSELTAFHSEALDECERRHPTPKPEVRTGGAYRGDGSGSFWLRCLRAGKEAGTRLRHGRPQVEVTCMVINYVCDPRRAVA